MATLVRTAQENPAVHPLETKEIHLATSVFRAAILVLRGVGLGLCSEAGRALEDVIKYPPAPSARGVRLRKMVDTLNVSFGWLFNFIHLITVHFTRFPTKFSTWNFWTLLQDAKGGVRTLQPYVKLL